MHVTKRLREPIARGENVHLVEFHYERE